MKDSSNNTTVEKRKKNKIYENVEMIISAIVIALLIRIFIVEAYKIPTRSMVPTLLPGDHLLVNKFIYGVRIPIVDWKLPGLTTPKRGDIVVFQYPLYKSPGWFIQLVDLVTFGVFNLDNTQDNPKNFIKRTIAVPGNILQIKDKRIRINQSDEYKIDTSTDYWPNLAKDEPLIKYPDKYDGPIEIYAEKIDDMKHYVQFKNKLEDKNLIDLKEPLYIPKKDDIIKIRSVPNSSIEFEGEKFPNPGSGSLIGYIKRNTSENNDFESISTKYVEHFYLRILFQEEREEVVEFAKQYADALPNSEKRQKNEILKYIETLSFNKIMNEDDTSDIELMKIYIDQKLKSKSEFIHSFKSNYYFMMGDNRDNSNDSRYWSFVNEDMIIGSALVIYLPFPRVQIIGNSL